MFHKEMVLQDTKLFRDVLKGSILDGISWLFSRRMCRLGTSLYEESALFFTTDFCNLQSSEYFGDNAMVAVILTE